MMGIENDVRLIGNLGGDPELSYTQAGVTVAKFSLATTARRKDRDGNRKEETSWHRVVIFGKLGDIAGEYLRKGSKIAVQGSIRYSKWEKDGVTHYGTDIIVDHMQMLDGKPAEEREPRQQRTAQRKPSAPSEEFEDDDIPF